MIIICHNVVAGLFWQPLHLIANVHYFSVGLHPKETKEADAPGPG